MDWQPIETAPKDETWILLYGDRYGEPCVYAAFWSTGDDPDWYDSECAGNPLEPCDGWPTHWMPLPEPPDEFIVIPRLEME